MVKNIAEFGDAPPAPGTEFNYATSNFFVLSLSLQNYVEAREGAGVRYWDLVRAEVLEPIGADTLDLIFTRGEDVEGRIPVMGYGARPTLDEAARIAQLIANEGAFEGKQLLNRQRIREALGRTQWRGFEARKRDDNYGFGFWTRQVETQGCEFTAAYMEGHGSNHIIILPSGAIILRFMDEFDRDIDTIIEAVERVRPSCQSPSG